MADPFSIVAGVAGIVAPAVHSTRVLLDVIQEISDAPAVVIGLKEDIQLVRATLESLQAVSESQWATLNSAVIEHSKTTIRICSESCDRFTANLENWTRRSGNDKLSFQDRATVGFLKQRQIKSMSEQLQKHRSVLKLVIGAATLSVTSPNAGLTME